MLPGAVKEESQPIPEWLVAKGGWGASWSFLFSYLISNSIYFFVLYNYYVIFASSLS